MGVSEELGDDMGVPAAKSLGKSIVSMLGRPSVGQQLRPGLMQGLVGALECKPDLNWPVFHLHSKTDDSPTSMCQEKHTVQGLQINSLHG